MFLFLHFDSSEEELPSPGTLEEKVSALWPHIWHSNALLYKQWTRCIKCNVSPQRKQQEIERVGKWLKMVKNWEKYRNSEKVCEACTQTCSFDFYPCVPFFLLSYVMNYFPFLLILCFPLSQVSLFPHLLPPLQSRQLKQASDCMTVVVVSQGLAKLHPVKHFYLTLCLLPLVEDCLIIFRVSVHICLCHMGFSCRNVCTKASLCSWEARPGPCFWT